MSELSTRLRGLMRLMCRGSIFFNLLLIFH